MIQVHYFKSYNIYKLQVLTNTKLKNLEEQGNKVMSVQSFVTSDDAFCSQITYRTPAKDV